ncbi:MAG: type III pantothenate kinase [Fimbriimonadaceae bacterium]|nr:type III pantothenate kinase [Fimbriimonadaceae bacterium]QYK55619.1 MAG: type III pantothenate kinase [Fimbriimonadaceae bacterium]
MLWAIDVGNTHTVIGRHDGQGWRAVWRLETGAHTEDALAATLHSLCELSHLPFAAETVIVGSVVPTEDTVWRRLSQKWLHVEPRFLERGDQVGLRVTYNPPHAVGADRLANALAAIERYGTPVVVVDFGTATTFDTVDAEASYVGGAIMPGVEVAVQALAQHTAKLPPIELKLPGEAIGRNTVAALESGVMYGYAGSVDAVAARIVQELGGRAKVVATGGLGEVFATMCERIDVFEGNLTLDGLLLAAERMS